MPGLERIAFVCPRLAEGATVGGAETLMRNLASHAQRLGHKVDFLTTCATDHFTWANERAPGLQIVDGLPVHCFPVDSERDGGAFLRVQARISRRCRVTRDEERVWLENSVNSTELCRHLSAYGDDYDRILMGPYLFGLIYAAARLHPHKTILVPCLHDEPFAYLAAIRDMFQSVRGAMFNTVPERDLAVRLYGLPRNAPVVGMGVDPFSALPDAFAAARGIEAPYLLYCGRREPLKGTPLLLDYLDAFRKRTARDIKLVLTGTGPVQVPPALSPHVLDIGFATEHEKHDAMAGALAFCHPSVNESLSIVLLESWLAETPALVHAGSAVMRYQCEQSNGGLPFRDYPEFEEEVIWLLEHPAACRAMGMAGRLFVLAEYSWPAIEKKMRCALDTL